MTRFLDTKTARDSALWPYLAAAILGIEGFSTIMYAAFLPVPFTDAGFDLAYIGHLPFVWLVAGSVAIVAAVGVTFRETWGRYLGVVSAVITILTALAVPTEAATKVIPLALPCLLLFALVARWPNTGPARNRAQSNVPAAAQAR